MKTINLGFETPDYSDMKEVATSAEPKKEQKMKTAYPSLYIDNAPAELMNLPDEGEALISFRVVSKRVQKRDGEANAGCELEITSITPKGMAKPMDSGGQSDAETAFDEFMGGSEEDGE